MLLKTFAESVKARPEWVLPIADSDEGGHIHEVRALIQEVRMEESVSSNEFARKRKGPCVYSGINARARLTHSEGLPIGVLDAREYGKPLWLLRGGRCRAPACVRTGWRVAVEERTFEATYSSQ